MDTLKWLKSDRYDETSSGVDKSRNGGFIKFLLHYRALFVKMLLLSIRKKGQTIAEIFIGLTFIGLLLGMRYILDRRYMADQQIIPFSPQFAVTSLDINTDVTYYYPINPCTSEIVRKAVNKLRSIIHNYPNKILPLSEESFSSLSNDMLESVHAYIIFTNMDSCTNQSTMPDQIQYILRMQEWGLYYYRAHRVKLSDVEIRWQRAPEDFCHDISVLVNYTNRFLNVQYATDISIIEYATNVYQNISLRLVTLTHLGCPDAYYDQLHTIYNFFIAVFFSIIYSVTLIMNIGYIVEERKNKTKEYLRIYGLRTWVNNLAWFSRSMCIYFILTCVVTGFCMLVIPSSQSYPNSTSKAVFNNTHWTLIWTILFVYSIHVSTFAVFFSQFFTRPVLAKMLGFLLWFFTFIDFYDNVPVGVLYFLCIFPNTGLMFCIKVLLQYERKANGVTTFTQLYSNLFPYPLYIGFCLLLMLFFSFIYMILAIYVDRVNPGEFGISQPWYYLFKKSYWRPKPILSTKEVNGEKAKRYSIVENNHWIETSSDSNAKLPILSINHLTKKFGKFVAVKNLSLDFYKGEVYTLLGHNGAGKTTTTFILVGMSEPTSGSIIVEGLDSRTHIQEIRKMIGFCPQYDILYDELSVREHLNLIAEMRHIERNKSKKSLNTILDMIGLTDKEDTLAKNLSGGLKRRLSIGIAMVGDPKILILDEPTSGIDPYNRRLIWAIIRKMKEAGKCIIMTTHFLEEAEVLSDRIAVMTKGRLQANGTPDFLKQQTEFEYRLFIDKTETCDTQLVTQFVQEHVQNAVLERQSTSELVYGIKRGALQLISRLINALDARAENIAIKRYGLSMTTIEEVFLKLIQEEGDASENNKNQKEIRENLANIVFLRNHNRITGFHLTWVRLWTFIRKRWTFSRRQIFTLLGFFLIPLIIEILTVATLPSPKDIQASLLHNERIKNAKVTLIPQIYNPQTIVININETYNEIKSNFVDFIKSTGASIEEITTNNITNYIRPRCNVSYDVYVNKYQMGFSLVKNLTNLWINAFYSTVNYHAMPTSLGVATTSLFQYYANSTLKSIQTTNQPILVTPKSSEIRNIFFDRISCFDTIPLSLFNFINAIIASIFISVLALNVIHERTTHFKDLQLLTNTSKKIYWLSNFVYDLMLCLIQCALLTIVVKIASAVHPNPEVEVQIYKGAEQTGYFFLSFVMYSLASLPLLYSVSFIPDSELLGLIMFAIINSVACFVDMVFNFIAVFSQSSASPTATKIGIVAQVMGILRWILSGLFPSINLKSALFNIRLQSNSDCISAINSIMLTTYSSNESWISFNEPGVGIQIVIFAIQIVFWWIVLSCIENRIKIGNFIYYYLNRIKHKTCNRLRRQTNPDDSFNALEWDDSKLDEDVRNERYTIIKNDPRSTSAVVLVRDLVQRFKKRKGKSIFSHSFTAVDHLNFYVPKRSCFGLLGANGAGKTTTFRMLISDIQPSSGEIILDGKNVNQINRNIDIGFCPQFDWLAEDLNVVEILTLFARLKGILKNEIPIICNDMMELFGLESYQKCKVKNLSGGNKRKVSTALAFMGNPSLIFLDEPTTGLDAGAKRKLWNVIRAARDADLTIIMTSHSMEECEALCTKIGIMKSGQLACLGSLQHLKNRFGKGYAVQIKVSSDKLKQFQQELPRILPGIEIEDEQNGVLFCNVPFSSSNNIQTTSFPSKLSFIFEILNSKKEENIIENYSVTQTTLEQIFVRLAGHDKHDDDTSLSSVTTDINLQIEHKNQERSNEFTLPEIISDRF